VQSGASLSGWDENGDNPLHAAVRMKDTQLAALMLSKGAKIDEVTRLAYRTAEDDHPQAAPVNQANQANRPAGARPAADPAPDYAKLGYKPRITLRPVEGANGIPPPPAPTTALLLAASLGSTDMMKMLVAAGAQADMKAEDGSNIVIAAASSGKLPAVEYALSLHPDLKDARRDGSTALHLAVANAKDDDGIAVVRYLIDKGAPLDGKNGRGQTPGAMAARGIPKLKALFDQISAEHASAPVPAGQTAVAATKG
jgi:ankyrin repeat protein